MKYQKIVAEVRAEYRDKPTGTRLPTHGELSKRYGISAATATRVTKLLCHEGWATFIPGRGVYVGPVTDGSTTQEQIVQWVSGKVDCAEDGETIGSLDHLAEVFKCSRFTVRRAMRQLAALGAVRYERPWWVACRG